MKNNSRSRFLPYIWSFLLFVFVSITVLSILVGAVFGNSSRISAAFTGDVYVDGLYNDAHLYAQDLCLEYGIDETAADAVEKEDIRNTVNSYVNNKLKLKGDSDYQQKISDISAKLTENAVSVAGVSSPEGEKQFEQEFSDYLTSRVEFVYIDNLRQFSDISAKASVCGVVAGALLCAASVVALIKVCGGRRRCAVFASDAVCASGFTTLIFTSVMMIYKSQKEFYFFPEYISQAVTKYVADCLYINLAAGAGLVVLSVIIALAARLTGKNAKG